MAHHGTRKWEGWDYPPGAENDPRAPWNEVVMPTCDRCGHEADDHDWSHIPTTCNEEGCDCIEYHYPGREYEDDDCIMGKK